MADFKNPAGSFGSGNSRDPVKGGKPDAGITNDSKGNLASKGAGPGVPANGSRIK